MSSGQQVGQTTAQINTDSAPYTNKKSEVGTNLTGSHAMNANQINRYPDDRRVARKSDQRACCNNVAKHRVIQHEFSHDSKKVVVSRLAGSFAVGIGIAAGRLF